jgi:hypothetical protein
MGWGVWAPEGLRAGVADQREWRAAGPHGRARAASACAWRLALGPARAGGDLRGGATARAKGATWGRRRLGARTEARKGGGVGRSSTAQQKVRIEP